MASEVDICNIALAHIGDTATVASINPPEGSIQSEHCQRFYPIARDTLLEMHTWDFATTRIKLEALTTTVSEWDYVYQIPNNMLNLWAILPPEAEDDYSTRFGPTDIYGYTANNVPWNYAGQYVPQPFTMEILSDGTKVIMTDQESAWARYSVRTTDTSKFSSLFITTLTWHLASYLAGPVIKGDVGAAEAKRCAQMAAVYLGQAKASDANQRQVKPRHLVPWVSGR